MANGFSKEERVAFEQVLEGFESQLFLLKTISKYNVDSVMMERAGNTIWRPQRYIMRSYDGFDQSNNFRDVTQLSVPVTINTVKASPWMMSATDLNDAIQEGRLVTEAKYRLAADVNQAIYNSACYNGSIFIKRTAAASGFDDVAAIDATLNERGVPMEDRNLALSSRDYNGMASNLATSTRSFGNDISDAALRRAFVGNIASFDTYKLDYPLLLPAAAGGAGITISTLAGGGNVYTPRARTQAASGEAQNVDNRFQTVTVSSTANVRAGDAFTIANVNAMNQFTKTDTGQLKTFRVTQVNSGTTMTITPPIISAQGGTDAELQYQNVVVTTPSATAAIVFLNTANAAMNPFWCKDALEIIPGRFVVPTGSGVDVMRGRIEGGLEVVMTKQVDIDTLQLKVRVDTYYGVANKQPEMSGVIMFSQP